jgi:hypothetical protein
MYRRIAIVILILMYINLNESNRIMTNPMLPNKIDSVIYRRVC